MVIFYMLDANLYIIKNNIYILDLSHGFRMEGFQARSVYDYQTRTKPKRENSLVDV